MSFSLSGDDQETGSWTTGSIQRAAKWRGEKTLSSAADVSDAVEDAMFGRKAVGYVSASLRNGSLMLGENAYPTALREDDLRRFCQETGGEEIAPGLFRLRYQPRQNFAPKRKRVRR